MLQRKENGTEIYKTVLDKYSALNHLLDLPRNIYVARYNSVPVGISGHGISQSGVFAITKK